MDKKQEESVITLREEFDKKVKETTKSNLEYLFESGNEYYIKWLENKIKQLRGGDNNANHASTYYKNHSN